MLRMEVLATFNSLLLTWVVWTDESQQLLQLNIKMDWQEIDSHLVTADAPIEKLQ